MAATDPTPSGDHDDVRPSAEPAPPPDQADAPEQAGRDVATSDEVSTADVGVTATPPIATSPSPAAQCPDAEMPPESAPENGVTDAETDAVVTSSALNTASAPPLAPTRPPKRTVGSHASGSYPRPASASPRASTGQPGTSSGAGRSPGGSPRMTLRLPAIEPAEDASNPPTGSGTHEVPVSTDAGGADGSGATGGGTSTAQPTRATIESLAQAMRALSPVHEEATAVTHALRVPGAAAVPPREITLVRTERAAVRIPPSRLFATRHPRTRRSVGSVITLVASLAMVIGTLLTAHLTGATANASARFEILNGGAKGQVALTWYAASGSFSLGIGGGAGPKVKAPGSAGLPVKKSSQNNAVPQQPPQGIGVSPAPVEPWPPNPWMAVPGTSPFAVQPVASFYPSSFGQCTWWAAYERKDEDLANLGNASAWAAAAAQRGFHMGDQPAPGATVVFQPGVQGAGGGGHVAHVIAVYPDGWFLISEMNFYWNGGGWGRVDYRYAHSGWGVEFIY